MLSLASEPKILIRGLLTAAILLFSQPLPGQEPNAWRTSADLTQQLQRPFDLTWDSVPLRDGLRSISQTQGVAIFLDRRVDPDQQMTMTFTNEPVETGLLRIAAETGNGMSRVGDVMYIGPEATATRLPTVAEIQNQFAKANGTPEVVKLVNQKHYQWSKLATPREILIDVAVAHDMTWSNLDQVVKHDLWPAADFPPLKTTEFLTLVLAAYDASYRFDKTASGMQLQLVPIPENLSLTRVHRFDGNHQDAVAKILDLFPKIAVKSNGKNSIEVTASQEVQEQVAKLLRGGTARSTVVTPGKKVYTMKISDAPRVAVIRHLAARWVELVLPEMMDEALNQRVAFSIENAKVNEVLDAVFKDSELTYTLEGNKLLVTKKPAAQ